MSAPGDLVEHVGEQRLEHGESVAHAARRAGQVHDQSARVRSRRSRGSAMRSEPRRGLPRGSPPRCPAARSPAARGWPRACGPADGCRCRRWSARRRVRHPRCSPARRRPLHPAVTTASRTVKPRVSQPVDDQRTGRVGAGAGCRTRRRDQHRRRASGADRAGSGCDACACGAWSSDSGCCAAASRAGESRVHSPCLPPDFSSSRISPSTARGSTALIMSCSVSPAIATAVRASISTPVRAVTDTVASIRIAPCRLPRRRRSRSRSSPNPAAGCARAE